MPKSTGKYPVYKIELYYKIKLILFIATIFTQLPSNAIDSKEVSAAWLHATMPKKPVVIMANAKLDDSYNFGYSELKKVYYSIYFYNEYGWGYIPRNSPGGKQLFNALSDGKEHLVKVAVCYTTKSQDCGSVFEIKNVIAIENSNQNTQKSKEISAAWLHATMPKKPVVIMANAKLDDSYNFGYCELKKVYYSIYFYNEYGWGYIPKNSPGGKKLFNALSDGKEHLVKVAVYYTEKSQDCGSVFEIANVISIDEKLPDTKTIPQTTTATESWEGDMIFLDEPKKVTDSQNITQTQKKNLPVVGKSSSWNIMSIDDALSAIVIIETNNDGIKAFGSGFILFEQGKFYLASNQHVFLGARQFTCRTVSGVNLEISKSVYISPTLDLIKFPLENLPNNIKAFEMSNYIPKMDGNICVLGNSEGAGVVRNIEGRVLGVGPDLIEVDAEFVEGNSGGPVIDENFNVYGVATYVIRNTPSWVKADTEFDNLVRRMAFRINHNTQLTKVALTDFLQQCIQISELDTFCNLLCILFCASIDMENLSALEMAYKQEYESQWANRWKNFILKNNIYRSCYNQISLSKNIESDFNFSKSDWRLINESTSYSIGIRNVVYKELTNVRNVLANNSTKKIWLSNYLLNEAMTLDRNCQYVQNILKAPY